MVSRVLSSWHWVVLGKYVCMERAKVFAGSAESIQSRVKAVDIEHNERPYDKHVLEVSCTVVYSLLYMEEEISCVSN